MPRRPRVEERDPLLREREPVVRLAVERVVEVRGDFAEAPLERELAFAPEERELVFAPDERELVFVPDEREEVRGAEDLARLDADLRPLLVERFAVERELAERDVDLRPAVDFRAPAGLRPAVDFRAPADLRPLPAPRVERVVEAVLELEDSSTFHLPESTR